MTNTMWGGRFAASPAAIMEEINASIDFDKRHEHGSVDCVERRRHATAGNDSGETEC